MNIDDDKRITWYVNSRATLEPLFRSRQAETLPTRRDEYLAVRRLRPVRGSGGHQNRCASSLDFEDGGDGVDQPTILVPVDLSPGPLPAVEVGASVAQQTQARLVLCHAIFPKVLRFGPGSPAWLSEALRSEALKKMQPGVTLAEEAGLHPTCEVDEGTPAGVILRLARKYAAALIVLTSREHGRLARLLFGATTAEQVIQEADCHVMVVRSSPA